MFYNIIKPLYITLEKKTKNSNIIVKKINTTEKQSKTEKND